MQEKKINEDLPEELTETGEKAGIQREIDTEVPQEPFNPKEISITIKIISLDAVIRRLKNKTIRLTPKFQRKLVWDKKRQSLLIESLMLNIPIAIFYVADDGEGNWDVVDGLQRLTAIKNFIVDKVLVLEGLEFWKNFNGHTIDDLPALPYNQIMETQFNFVIIEPSTPESVKYNIFKRINTGGVPLSNQEIRHALFQGKGTDLLADLSESEDFQEATGESIDDSRMAAREIILRCLSFILLGRDGYLNNDTMDSFLRKGLHILNNLDDLSKCKFEKEHDKDIVSKVKKVNYEELTKLFNTGMQRNFLLFEDNAFRISLQNRHRAPVNKSLFETWGSLLALLPEKDFLAISKNKNNLFSFYEEKKKEQKFNRAVSRDAWKKVNVDYRFDEIANIIQRTLDAGKN
jgi:hypothetical protein